jgi:predicted anti-sigma-YlaC factor YlaD
MIAKCKEIESLLSAYLENELSAADAGRVAGHLAECPDCRAVKEKLEELLLKMSELQEEVPFFLKNRLYNIPEFSASREPGKIVYLPKWLAAAAGTIILFLNLFYFTNIFPMANRQMHMLVGTVESFVVKTGGWIEKIKESKDLLVFTFFNKKEENKDKKMDAALDFVQELSKGGKNG